MNLIILLQTGVLEFSNRYSPVVLYDVVDVLLFHLILILSLLLIFTLYMHFKTRGLNFALLTATVQTKKFKKENADDFAQPTQKKTDPAGFSERDKRVEFVPEKNLYLVDGSPATSVREAVDLFFPEADSSDTAARLALKRGKTKREIKAELGREKDADIFLHEQIENYFNGEIYDTPPAFKYFLNFIHEHPHLDRLKTGWNIFDEEKKLACTIDFVADNGYGTCSIYDWIRSKELFNEFNLGGPLISTQSGPALEPLHHIDNTELNKQYLQMGLRKQMLEKNYNLPVKETFLVVFHPRYSDYYIIDADKYPEEAEFIYRNFKS